MKKIYILPVLTVLLLSAGLLAFLPSYHKEQTVLILNHAYFDTLAKRQELYACAVGGKGTFSQAPALTLYAQSETVEDYRRLKMRLESWGATVTLKKGTELSIFDIRANGSLPLYFWTAKEQEIFPIFHSKNAEFYSTGWQDGRYDRLLVAGDTQKQKEVLLENICAIWIE